MRRLRRFLRLTTLRRRLVVLAAALFWLTRLLMLFRSFHSARRALSVLITTAKRAFPIHGGAPPGDLAWAVATAGRLSSRNCLIRALAAQALVELQGGKARLVIGTRRNLTGALEAHAWLEHDGRIIVGAHDDHFVTMARFERTGA